MSGINDTAYPQLRTEISDQDLISVFTPTATERRFIAHAYSRATTQALIAVQLKLLQRLGYFVTMDIVPNAVIMITGSLASSCRMRRSVSSPVMPPMRTSISTRSG